MQSELLTLATMFASFMSQAFGAVEGASMPAIVTEGAYYLVFDGDNSDSVTLSRVFDARESPFAGIMADGWGRNLIGTHGLGADRDKTSGLWTGYVRIDEFGEVYNALPSDEPKQGAPAGRLRLFRAHQNAAITPDISVPQKSLQALGKCGFASDPGFPRLKPILYRIQYDANGGCRATRLEPLETLRFLFKHGF